MNQVTFTVEKSGKPHVYQVINANITDHGVSWHHVPLDGMCRVRQNTTFIVVLPKIAPWQTQIEGYVTKEAQLDSSKISTPWKREKRRNRSPLNETEWKARPWIRAWIRKRKWYISDKDLSIYLSIMFPLYLCVCVCIS